MSKYNIVNPGQYKTAGRDRPNKVAEVRMKETREHAAKSAQKPRRRQTAKNR